MQTNPRLSCVVAAAALMGTSAWSLARQDEGGEGAPEVNAGAIHLELGLDWTSAYYFRGLVQEDNGFIFQNWLDVGIDLVERDDWTLSTNFGIWNSFHEETDTAGTTDSFLKHLFETDYYAQLELEAGSWTIDLLYVLYTSPSDAFDTIGEIDLSVGFDDSGLWNDRFALNPSVTLAFEVHDGGGTEDSYLELGIAPGFERTLGKTAVSIEFPVVVGFSIDDYYIDANDEEDCFGFVQAGVEVGVPLGVPERFGVWTLNGGVSVLLLGQAAEDANDGDDTEVIGHFGLTIAY